MIFCIGAHKTGTTSLEEALKILNDTGKLKESIYFLNDNIHYKHFFATKNELINLIQSCKELNRNTNAFRDSPYNLHDNYKTIDKTIDNCKFILTVRDGEEWYDSVINWNKYGNGSFEIYKNIYGYDFNDQNKESIIKEYTKRNNDIIDYFKNRSRCHKLLVINVCDDKNKDNLMYMLLKYLNNEISSEDLKSNNVLYYNDVNSNTLFKRFQSKRVVDCYIDDKHNNINDNRFKTHKKSLLYKENTLDKDSLLNVSFPWLNRCN